MKGDKIGTLHSSEYNNKAIYLTSADFFARQNSINQSAARSK